MEISSSASRRGLHNRVKDTLKNNGLPNDNPFLFLLPDQDSNLDKQNQNLSYYHYTIGQSVPNGSAKIMGGSFSAK